MKKIKFIAIIGVFAILFGTTSCQKWINEEINVDPDRPTDVTPDLLMSSAEVSIGYLFGGFDVAGITGIWMQYLQGTDRQARAIDGYSLTEADVNNLWNSVYTGVLMDLQDMMQRAEAKNATGLIAISKILTAYTLSSMTALFGDLPYSQAFQGVVPAYDSEQEIYTTIFALLDDAVNLLSSPDVVPLNDVEAGRDIIFGGDLDAWNAFAKALRARVALRLEKRQAPDWAAIIDDAQAYIDYGAVAAVPFYESAIYNNPMYQYVDQRSGYIADNSFYQSTLYFDYVIVGTDTIDDPRYGVVYIGDSDDPGPLNQTNSPVYLISLSEAYFIKAEALARSGAAVTDIQDALIEAVTASLVKFDAVDVNWLTGYESYVRTNLTTVQDLLDEIYKQKYIDNFINPEAWADYRRTGYPALTPTTGNELPHRYPYPTDETSYNPNTPDYGSIFNPLWFEG